MGPSWDQVGPIWVQVGPTWDQNANFREVELKLPTLKLNRFNLHFSGAEKRRKSCPRLSARHPCGLVNNASGSTSAILVWRCSQNPTRSPTLGRLGCILVSKSAKLAPSWSRLGPSWAKLCAKPSWTRVEPSWGQVGTTLGASLARGSCMYVLNRYGILCTKVGGECWQVSYFSNSRAH